MRPPATSGLWISILFTLFCETNADNCYLPECEYRTSVLPPMSMFSTNEIPIATKGRGYLISPPNGTECYMNLTSIMEAYNFDRTEPAVGIFGIICREPYLVYLSELESEPLSNIWFYFQMQGCQTTTQSLSRMSRATELRTITSHQSFIYSNMTDCLPDKANDSCHALMNTYSIWIANSEKYPEQDFDKLFSCSESFPNLTEVSVDSMKWKNLPQVFSEKFTNLQALELTNGDLIDLPNFPWTDKRVYLPRNLTMGKYFLEQYADVYHMILNPKVYRRLINLNHNNIQSLLNYSFGRNIDMIRLEGNKIKELDVQTFSNVKNLQHLDLNSNKLSSLPETVFHGLKSLRHLDLKNNLLTQLPVEVFKDLHELVYINLANNSLQSLEKGIFANLFKIEKINLSNNKLKTLDYLHFPLSSVTLSEIYLDNNPLTELPVFIFYIRHLKIASLRSTPVTFNDLSGMSKSVIWPLLVDSIMESSSTTDMKFFQAPEKLKTVDLTSSNVTTISIGNKIPIFEARVLTHILINFKFILTDNDLLCDCNIVNFSQFIAQEVDKGHLTGREYFFKDWICSYPSELRGQNLLAVRANDTYCAVNVTHCPVDCTCYKRTNQPVILVDCREQGLIRFPENVPEGIIDLWLQHNNISEIRHYDYFPQIRQLRLSHNQIKDVSPVNFNIMKTLEILNLDSNHLTDLPENVRSLSLTHMTLEANPFRCDCRTKWMKQWILRSNDVIKDWEKILCNDASEEGKQFVSVPDDDFICIEEFDSFLHVVTPSVSVSVAITLLLICLCLLHVYRFEVKVLLYIYTGLHPFDRDSNESAEEIDVLIIHANDVTDWVFKNIIDTLEAPEHQFIVCEISRDFVAGFSYQENIVSMIRKSKRIIFVLSENMTDDHDLCKVAWNESQEKIKELRTNYAIFISHGFSHKNLSNKEILRYIKRSRLIDYKDSLLTKKILYNMPNINRKGDNKDRTLPDIRQCLLNMYEHNQKLDEEEQDVFVVYGEKEMVFAAKDLRIFLEERGYSLILSDRDFLPGAAKEENVLRSVASCNHTIFLMSDDHLEDEWSVFTFRSAVEKSLRDKCNHLIVLTLDINEAEVYDEEVRYYLKTHVVLNHGDRWFWERLLLALPKKTENANNQRRQENNEIGKQYHEENGDRPLEGVVNNNKNNGNVDKLNTGNIVIRAKACDIENKENDRHETKVLEVREYKGFIQQNGNGHREGKPKHVNNGNHVLKLDGIDIEMSDL